VRAHLMPSTTQTTRDGAVGVAGFVPQNVAEVRLDAADTWGRSWVTDVRDGAYYFDDPGAYGRFILTFVNASGATARVGIDTRNVRWSFVRRDVGASELTKLRGVASPFRRPTYLTRGVGDAMWVVDPEGNRIYRIRRNGDTRDIPMPTFDSVPSSVALDRAGNAWVTETRANAIARIDTEGGIREYALPAIPPDVGETTSPGLSVPQQIVLGSDGRMWFRMRLRSAIGAIDSRGTIVIYPLMSGAVPESSRPQWIEAIAEGADGRLWFGGRTLGSMGIDGSIRRYRFSDGIGAMTATPDGMWATSWDSIVHIDLDGTVHTFPVPLAGSGPYAIAASGDGSLAFADFTGNVMGTVSKTGTLTLQYAMFLPAGIVSFSTSLAGDTSYAMPLQHTIVTGDRIVTVAGDPTYLERDDVGNIWFSEPDGNAVGYVEPTGEVRFFPLPKP